MSKLNIIVEISIVWLADDPYIHVTLKRIFETAHALFSVNNQFSQAWEQNYANYFSRKLNQMVTTYFL